MPITGLKTWVTSDALSAANLNADKTVLEAKFNAGIVTADIADDAVTNDKVANPHYEIILNMTVRGNEWAGATAEDIVALAGLPGDVNNDTYTIVQIDYSLFSGNTGAGIAAGDKARVEWGYFGSTDSAWTPAASGVIVTAANFNFPAVSANQGAAGTLTKSVSTLTASTTNKQFLAIILDTKGAGFTTADELLTVSVKLKRTSGLRS